MASSYESAGAMAIAMLGLIEATSIARAVAAQSGQRLDFNREFVGQGGSMLVGSFFSCFPGSGSFTRTAVNYASGGRTRLASAFSKIASITRSALATPCPSGSGISRSWASSMARGVPEAGWQPTQLLSSAAAPPVWRTLPAGGGSHVQKSG